jgi:plasmid stabilization system protein ParE
MGTPQSVERRPTVISAAPTPTAFYQNNTVKINSLIWLDTEVNKNEENRQAKQQLHNIIHHIKPFEDPHECQQYIQRAPTNYRIILIASGTLGRQIVPYIHNLKQISAIYIYCVDKQKNEQWAQQFHKVRPFLCSFLIQKNLVH